jgi:hypothetical protein
MQGRDIGYPCRLRIREAFMNEVYLRLVFRRILLAALPLPATLWVACGSDLSTPPDTIVTSCGEVVPNDPSNLSFSCQAKCIVFDGGAIPPPMTEGGTYSLAECETLCGQTGSWFSCEAIQDAGVALMRCQPNCTGRRPPGLFEEAPEAASPIGAYFAAMAQLEAASVHAFRILRRELSAHRAPRRLVQWAGRAAREERAHTRIASSLARRFGGRWSPPRVERSDHRDLEQLALDNAAEGCVRETFGALLATVQARRAADPIVRAAMARIARDETRHAALAWQISAWAEPRLSQEARRRVRDARHEAARMWSSEAQREPDPAIQRLAGAPDARVAQALAKGLFDVLSVSAR